MNAQEKEPDYAAMRTDLIAVNKLTINAVFVPFSQSRNKEEDRPTLNWKITLLKDGREIIQTDYSQGIAHAPSYKNAPRRSDGDGKIDNHTWQLMQAAEAETGRRASCLNWRTSYIRNREKLTTPKLEDVLYSLIMDSDVIDYPSFEEWADNFGMDTDSRAGEKMYRACLETALKLRAGLGETLITALREAFTDY